MKSFIKFIFIVFVICSSYEDLISQNGWFRASSPTQAWLKDIHIVDSSNMYIVGNGYTVLKSTNAGSSWYVQYYYANWYDFYSVSFINQMTGYVSGGYQYGIDPSFGTIFKTTNGGVNWLQIYSDPSVNYYTLISKINPLKAIASSSNYAKITTDGGASWNSLGGYGSNFKAICFLDSLTGYGIRGGQFAKTTNGGNNWTQIPLGIVPPSANLLDISFPDSNTGYILGMGGNPYFFVIKTTNSGTNWVLTDLITNVSELFSIFCLNSDTVYFTGRYSLSNYGRIFRTTNGGQNWVLQYDSQLPYSIPYSISFLNKMTGFAVGLTGLILKTTTGGEDPLGLINEFESTPKDFYLDQNYPNPFNPSTLIKFEVPGLKRHNTESISSATVELKIFDALGKEAAILLNQKLSPGSYEVEWNASEFPSGIYFYRLISGGFVETRKMVLLK